MFFWLVDTVDNIYRILFEIQIRIDPDRKRTTSLPTSCVFEMNEEGKAVAVVDTTEENRGEVIDAIDACPVSAIREEE